jgi:hypothetical protein
MNALGSVLLKLTSVDVLHTGDIPQGCRRLGSDAIVQVPASAPVVVGLFRDAAGAEYVMLVNRDHREPVAFEATFRPHVTEVFSISREDALESPVGLQDGRLPLKLEPGDGRLFRLQTEFAYPEPPTPVARIDFRFDPPGEAEGWGALGGVNSVSIEGVAEGALALTITGSDPFVCRSMLDIPADMYSRLRVRMKLPPCDATGQVFWTTAEEPGFADDKYLNFPTQPDGEWHEYVIPVGEHPKWEGQAIRALRLDPTTGGAAPGSQVRIDAIAGE